MMSKIYLRSNTILEPLVWNWHAWAHLISPLTASMHIKNRHLKIMRRFIENGQKNSIKIRSLKGGQQFNLIILILIK